MTVQFTFLADRDDLPAVQRVVKRHNMRFVSNPAAWVGRLSRLSVTVEADDTSHFNDGSQAIRAIIDRNNPALVTPVRRSWFGKLR